jgi:caffeoyl-CoA O-methyltransferase
MELIQHKAEEYAKQHTTQLDDVLREIEAHTLASHPHAQMLSGHVQGKLLEMISRMIRPQAILEIGTFTGFSALCLVRGLQPEGKLHTIEIRQEDAETAARYFKKAGMDYCIELHVGNALEIIPTLPLTWDLVFIDADKVGYIDYYELTLPLVKKGGWIVADNVLFHGEVLGENVKGKNALAIRAFNEHVRNDDRVHQVMLTVRDGLMLIQKK